MKWFKNFLKTYVFKHRGTTRLVFLFPKYGFVIKIPNFTYSMQLFLLGCYCNWNERVITKQFSKCDNIECKDIYNKISPTYFCSWFGFISIQKYVYVLSVNSLNDDDKSMFTCVTNDFNYRNFGYTLDEKTGEFDKLVCLDYGNPL
jgi:hypothetical protein